MAFTKTDLAAMPPAKRKEAERLLRTLQNAMKEEAQMHMQGMDVDTRVESEGISDAGVPFVVIRYSVSVENCSDLADSDPDLDAAMDAWREAQGE